MAAEVEQTPTPGRPVELVPAPTLAVAVAGGGWVATLGPMFGFLIGTAQAPVEGACWNRSTLVRSPVRFWRTGVLAGAVRSPQDLPAAKERAAPEALTHRSKTGTVPFAPSLKKRKPSPFASFSLQQQISAMRGS